MSLLTTAVHLSHRALELGPDETTNTASQLEAHSQSFTAEHFQENQDIVEQTAYHVADKGPRQFTQRKQPKC
jgi:hypothetical protein